MKIKYFEDDDEVQLPRALKKIENRRPPRRAFDDEVRKEKRGAKPKTNRRPRDDFDIYG
jgi:hypothetical protein